jgi:YrbI family 3-deoxy-D-manno-octulosonate 8-phosphate phosphatase
LSTTNPQYKSQIIQALAFDVDGVLTPKYGYFNHNKPFESLDYDDLSSLRKLKEKGYKIAFITASRSKELKQFLLENFASDVYLNSLNKLKDLEEFLSQFELPLSHACYMGDSLNDLEALSLVGISGCPADASSEIKKSVQIVCRKKGGNGAIAEFIQTLQLV